MIDDSQRVQNKIGFYPWLVWGLAAAFFFCEYFARVAPGVMVSELMQDFKVNALALGSLSAFFYYSYVGMQVPVGILVDRYGPHRLLTISILLFGGGCLLFAYANNVHIAELGRFLMGLTGAFAFVGSLKLAAVWFPASRFGLLAGLTQALGMLGAAVGEAPMSYSVATLGWRITMAWIAGIFIVLAILVGFFVRDRPAHAAPNHHELATGKHVLAGLKAVLRNSQSWWNALYAGLVYAPTAAFAELWGVSFLVHTYHISQHLAAMGIGLIFIGWGVGGPLVGWWSDHMGRRKPVMLISALAGFFIILTILYIPLPLPLLYVLLFCYGVFNTGVATSYAVATEISVRAVAGTSLAFANMASVLVGAAFQPVIGWLLDRHWNGQLTNGIPAYSASNFHEAMIILPICMLLGVLVAFKVKETYCQSQDG